MKLKTLLLTTLTLILTKTSLAFHGTEEATGNALPIYEETTANLLYLAAPLLLFTSLTNEIIQKILAYKYKDSTLKNARDLQPYTLTISAILNIVLLYTPIYQVLPTLDLYIYAATMSFLLGITLLLAFSLKPGQIQQYIEKIQ